MLNQPPLAAVHTDEFTSRHVHRTPYLREDSASEPPHMALVACRTQDNLSSASTVSSMVRSLLSITTVSERSRHSIIIVVDDSQRRLLQA